MFRSISIEEENLLLKTIRICMVGPRCVLLNERKKDRHSIYFYPNDNYDNGIIVFDCFKYITNDSYILDSIELCEDSDDLYGLDEEVVYSLIPLLINFSIESAVLAKKDEVILKSGLTHFADHLVDNKFRIYKRIERTTLGQFNMSIKGVKNIKKESIVHETSTY